MKTATLVAVAIATLASIPLLAQQTDATGEQRAAATAAETHVSDSAHAGAQASADPRGVEADGSTAADGSRGTVGFGDEAASHAWEMSSVSGELQNKLDSMTAKVGDGVVLKTTERVYTSDGTVIPRGSRLVGHVIQVQAHDKDHANSQMGIAFDRAELKEGQSVAIYTLLRGVSPSASAMAMSSRKISTDNGDSLGASMGNGGMAGGAQTMGGGHVGGGGMWGGGAAVSGQAGGVVDRTPYSTSQADAGLEDTAVQTDGHGDLNLSSGAHAEAAARAVPRPTGIPGVMLAGSSSSSGIFSASQKNVQFESGTEMQLGIVADR